MAMKCGSCHRKRMPKTIHPPTASSFVAAVQPISGGTAPGIAPMTADRRDSLRA
jgi:hypothetical protein